MRKCGLIIFADKGPITGKVIRSNITKISQACSRMTTFKFLVSFFGILLEFLFILFKCLNFCTLGMVMVVKSATMLFTPFAILGYFLEGILISNEVGFG